MEKISRITAGAAAFIIAFSAMGLTPAECPFSESVSVSAAEYNDSVSGFSYKAESDRIELSWNKLSSAYSYRIDVKNSSGKYEKAEYKLSKTKDGKIKATITGLSESTKYTFKVTPIKKSGDKTVSGKGKTVSASTKVYKITAPSADYTGLHKDSRGTYYFSGGVLQTGFVSINGSTYYFDPKTYKMYTGWVSKGGKDYYFLSNGKMAVGTYTIDDESCTFRDDGSLIGQKPNKEQKEFLDAVIKYIDNSSGFYGFKDPSSVKLIGPVYKLENYSFKYPDGFKNGKYSTQKISGYYLKVSATNGFGARTTDDYFLCTECKSLCVDTNYDVYFGRGFRSKEKMGMNSHLIFGLGSGMSSPKDSAVELDFDMSEVNDELKDRLERIGY